MKLALLIFFIPIVIAVLYACRPLRGFDHTPHPPAPNYGQESSWYALPWRKDIADTVPKGCSIPENQQNAKADVFYVHPTMYFRGATWNADINNKKVTRKTEVAVQHQATVFNAHARVFVPKYRQAVLKSFFNKQKGQKPLDLAYEDIKAAFEYYLKNWNNGRPIIIAGHSQGARHAAHLLKDFFEGKSLQKQLVVAYTIGFPIKDNEITQIPFGVNEKQIGCYITWNTLLWGANSVAQQKIYDSVPCVNPLTWKNNSEHAADSLNKGGVTFKRFEVIANACDAQVQGNVLWIHKPKHKHFFRLGKSYHLFDVNLFYMNLRENVGVRIEEYLKKI